MIKRILEQRIQDKSFQGKAILLFGHRQTGKTTLLNTLFSHRPDTRWLNGDDAETWLLLEDVTLIKWKRILGDASILRNGVKIISQFQADYFGVSQLSFEANSGAI